MMMHFSTKCKTSRCVMGLRHHHKPLLVDASRVSSMALVTRCNRGITCGSHRVFSTSDSCLVPVEPKIPFLLQRAGNPYLSGMQQCCRDMQSTAWRSLQGTNTGRQQRPMSHGQYRNCGHRPTTLHIEKCAV